MSKQLAISSAFAVFAMAAMTLSLTADYRADVIGVPAIELEAAAPSIGRPVLPELSPF